MWNKHFFNLHYFFWLSNFFNDLQTISINSFILHILKKKKPTMKGNKKLYIDYQIKKKVALPSKMSLFRRTCRFWMHNMTWNTTSIKLILGLWSVQLIVICTGVVWITTVPTYISYIKKHHVCFAKNKKSNNIKTELF